jgi:hypothetical protein
MAKVRFLRELRRRRVFRVAATYAVVGWLLIQIASQVFLHAGEKAAATELVGEALALPNTASISPAILRFNPLWDPLRDDPRFLALLNSPPADSKGAAHE